MKLKLIAVAAILSLSAGCSDQPSAPASQAVLKSPASVLTSPLLLDTGPGSGPSYLYIFALGTDPCPIGSVLSNCAGNFSFIGGKFSFANDVTIDGIQAWMKTERAGSIDLMIRADVAGVPGPSVHSQTFSLGTNTGYDWRQFESYNVNLPAGTYWLTLEPVAGSGLVSFLQGGVASPMPGYAFTGTSIPWVINNAPIHSGFRINGFIGTTPSEKITDLRNLISGFGLPHGTGNAADAKLRAALDALSAGNTAAACADLQDEINFVRAQSGKHISAADAAAIIAAVNVIRAQLGC